MCLQLLPIIKIYTFLLLLCRFGHLICRDLQVESRFFKFLSLRASWLFRSYLEGIYIMTRSVLMVPLLILTREQGVSNRISCCASLENRSGHLRLLLQNHAHIHNLRFFPPLYVFPKLWLLHYFSFDSAIFFAEGRT